MIDNKTVSLELAQKIMGSLITQILYLAESSLDAAKFKAFRKLTLDYLEDWKRRLKQDWCGEKQSNSKKGGAYE